MQVINYKETALGTIPENWSLVPLRDILNEVDIRVKDFAGGDASKFEVLSLTKAEGLIPQTERFKKRIATEDVSNYKVVKHGNIVYNPYVIWEGAVHALLRYDYGLVSPAYPILEAVHEVADPFFLDLLLRTPLAISAYNRFASGAVNRRRAISKRDFGQIEVPLPPLPEQRAIAYMLNTVRQSIEATERVIAAARELKRSLIKHLFTYGPIAVDDVNQVALKETEIGKVAEGWVKTTVGDIFNIQLGKMLSAASRKGISPRPYIRNANVQWGYVDISDLNEMDFLPRQIEKFRLKENDILVCEGGDVGRTSIWKNQIQECYYQKAIHRLRQKNDNVLPEFFLYFMMNVFLIRHVPIVLGAKSTIAHLPLEKLKEMPFVLPSMDEQRKIVDYIKAVDGKIELENRRKNGLGVFFESLLRHLMTGKVQLQF